MRLVDGKDVPMPNKLIFIRANEANYGSNATTDEHGLVQFSINTTNIMGTSLTVNVSFQRSDRWQEVALGKWLQPKSDNMPKLCLVLKRGGKMEIRDQF